MQAGTTVGHEFRILEPLGSGGMGAVYLAEQASTRKLRAVKMMHARLSDDAKQRERFTQEARVAAAVASDHVVEIIAAGVDDDSGIPWIAMELLEGDDLSAHVKRVGPLSVGATATVLEQLCHALGAAHAAGIVHRDLKPHNVFMAESRTADARRMVKVLDFGIAKLIADSTMSTTAALGSPAWMAPEQTEASPHISAACDVWSLGLVTFWILTGRSFWRSASSRDGSVQGVLRELVIEAIPSGSDRARELGCEALWPPLFDPWLARCLARDPSRRFANAEDAHEAFVAALDGRPMPDFDDAEAATARPDDDEGVTDRGDVASDPLPSTRPTLEGADTEPSRPAGDEPPASLPTREVGESKSLTSTQVSSDFDHTASPLTRIGPTAPSAANRRIVLGGAALATLAGGFLLLTGERPHHAAATMAETALVATAAPSFSAAPTRASANPKAAAPSAEPAHSATPAVSSPVRRLPASQPTEDDLPPFDHARARGLVSSSASHARNACKSLEGPRRFSATLVYHRSGQLDVQGSFQGAAGACVKATLGMARVGPFGPGRARAQSLPARVTLPD